MSEQTQSLTVDEIVVAAAAAAQKKRTEAAQAKEAVITVATTKTVNSMFVRSKHQNFNPAMTVAYRDAATGVERCCWLAADGKTAETNTQVEIELPPFQLARGSTLVGEGDVFKPIPKKKDLFIDRTQAHFKAIFIHDISSEMKKAYPDWESWQNKTVENVRAASLKMITDTFTWTDSAAWQAPIKNAHDYALGKINFPGKEKMSDVQIKKRIDGDAALGVEFREIALASYLKNARYPFKPRFDEVTELPLAALVTATTKVYSTKSYDAAIYNNKAEGPNKVELPSCNENMARAMAAMATLPGKGGGIDERVYLPIKFVNHMPKPELTAEQKKEAKKLARKRKSNQLAAAAKVRDPIEDRPNVTLADGRTLPNYWWNPTAWENGAEKGKMIQSYATAVLGFMLTCSEQGGYGIKCILKHARTIYVQDYEYVNGREVERYGKRVGGPLAVTDADNEEDGGDGAADADDSTEDMQPTDDEAKKAADRQALEVAEQQAAEAEEQATRRLQSLDADDCLPTNASAAAGGGGGGGAKRAKTSSGRGTPAVATAPTKATYGDIE